MLVLLKRFTILLVALSSLSLLPGFSFASEVPYSDDDFSFTGDLTNPEQVIAYIGKAPEDRKKWAEKGYSKAVRDTGRLKVGASWGSVAKSCFESLRAYPTGKAYFLGIEARLRNWAEARTRKKHPMTRAISRESFALTVGWLNSAIAVEAYEPTLDETQRAKLVPYRDCLKRYLDTGKAEPACTPLRWAGVVGGK